MKLSYLLLMMLLSLPLLSCGDTTKMSDPQPKPQPKSQLDPQPVSAKVVADVRIMKKVQDFGPLRSGDNNQIDPGFWECVRVIEKMGFKRIRETAVNLKFSSLREDPHVDRDDRKKLQAAYEAAAKRRASMRGKIFRVKGKMVEFGKPVIFVDGQKNKRRFKCYLMLTHADDLERGESDSYMIYYFGNNSPRHDKLLEIEGAFLKICEFKNKRGQEVYLPLIISNQLDNNMIKLE